jgi:hypothetical protein
VGAVVAQWRREGQERAFVRFETAPGEQAQMDWGHFGNWGGKRLYGFALTLCWSRMQYVEFTQWQDAETLLNCMVHALAYFGGVPATVLTDNMKMVVLDRVDGQPRFHAKMLDFANYYGFVPRVCHPYRPQTKGKIESTIRYIKGSFWPGLSFDSLQELNRQALAWCGEVSTEVRATIICGSDGYGKLARPIRAPEGGPASSDQPRSTPESREPVKGILVLLAGFLAIPGVYLTVVHCPTARQIFISLPFLVSPEQFGKNPVVNRIHHIRQTWIDVLSSVRPVNDRLHRSTATVP